MLRGSTNTNYHSLCLELNFNTCSNEALKVKETDVVYLVSMFTSLSGHSGGDRLWFTMCSWHLSWVQGTDSCLAGCHPPASPQALGNTS